MSSFSAKLERVRLLPTPSPAGAREALPALAMRFDRAHCEESIDATSRETNSARGDLPRDPIERLDALRLKIAAILTKAPPIRRRPADPSEGDLPFALESTPEGPLYVRTKRFSAAHRVGRASVSQGKQASAGMLALLALDPTLSVGDPERMLYIDTETTGLSAGAGTVPFLIGMAWFDRESSSLVMEQLLLRQLGEEAPMLTRFAERVARASALVTYNGKSFDLPLLRSRLVLNRLPALPHVPHLDLVHVARRLHRHRMRELTLANVEAQVLGFVRTADISGGEVCSRYSHFLRTGDASALLAVIDHNEWDVVAMAALVGLYGEPLEGLGPTDWASVARTLRRAGSLDLAREFASLAVERGAGHDAVRARGEIAKARGDKAQALADFASLVESVDDPALRLELAKLYEHHAREPMRALEMVERGTGEGEEAAGRRRTRLERKRDRKR
ncbi:MAG TPA: ribonuclease H-like domain-containing protein [Polyangiaceae bacterium]|nr:ribonuclease H-like domain-containing protein [Polyangiaceae bacterium]